jgi:hypothetical protein
LTCITNPGKLTVIYVCARGVEFVSVCDVFLLDFGPVPTVQYFCFSFYLVKLWFHYYSNIFSYRSYQKCLNNDNIYSSKVIYCIYVTIHSFYILNTIILQQLGRSITLHITLSGFAIFLYVFTVNGVPQVLFFFSYGRWNCHAIFTLVVFPR